MNSLWVATNNQSSVWFYSHELAVSIKLTQWVSGPLQGLHEVEKKVMGKMVKIEEKDGDEVSFMLSFIFFKCLNP